MLLRRGCVRWRRMTCGARDRRIRVTAARPLLALGHDARVHAGKARLEPTHLLKHAQRRRRGCIGLRSELALQFVRLKAQAQQPRARRLVDAARAMHLKRVRVDDIKRPVRMQATVSRLIKARTRMRRRHGARIDGVVPARLAVRLGVVPIDGTHDRAGTPRRVRLVYVGRRVLCVSAVPLAPTHNVRQGRVFGHGEPPRVERRDRVRSTTSSTIQDQRTVRSTL